MTVFSPGGAAWHSQGREPLDTGAPRESEPRRGDMRAPASVCRPSGAWSGVGCVVPGAHAPGYTMSPLRGSIRNWAAWFCVLVALAAGAGCRQQMAEQPRYDPMEESAFWADGRSARPLEPGTVPRGYLRADGLVYDGMYPRRWWTGLNDRNARTVDEFPFTVTAEVLERGREQFNIRCAVCHDRVGHGQGKVPQRGYVQPPSYHLDPVRKQPVGHYYRVITNGWGAMPAFNDQVTPRDRWCIVAYIRALQASQDEAFLETLEKGGGR
jgi:mono/diheme cytochrome c family protein